MGDPTGDSEGIGASEGGDGSEGGGDRAATVQADHATGHGAGREGALRRVIGALARACAPGANPSGVVYGVVAVGTLIAAEGFRRETYPDVVGASALALLLFWLAHSYARDFAQRLDGDPLPPLRRMAVALAHEAAILEGAALPVVAVMAAWASGADLNDGVTAGLWSAGIEILVLEVVAGISRQAAAREVVRDVVIGTLLGGGLLGVHALLH